MKRFEISNQEKTQRLKWKMADVGIRNGDKENKWDKKGMWLWRDE